MAYYPLAASDSATILPSAKPKTFLDAWTAGAAGFVVGGFAAGIYKNGDRNAMAVGAALGLAVFWWAGYDAIKNL